MLKVVGHGGFSSYKIYVYPFTKNIFEKGRAFHAGTLVLALAKIQDIFKKYSG